MEGCILEDNILIVSCLFHINPSIDGILRSVHNTKISIFQRLCLILEDTNYPVFVCSGGEVVQLGENTDSPLASRVNILSESDLQGSGHAYVLGGVLDGEDDGVVSLEIRDIEILYLLADVVGLAADGGPGKAGEVSELEVGVVRGVDVEHNRLVAHALGVPNPQHRPLLNLLLNAVEVVKSFLLSKFISPKYNLQTIPLRNLMQPLI